MSDTNFLLDTNVVSEARRRKPEAKVGAFLDRLDADQMFVSVMTVGELRKGAEARRRTDFVTAAGLSDWIGKMELTFTGRILPVDAQVADLWGRLSAVRPRPIVDTLIAATAIVHGMTLVTRNVRDVADTGVAFVNPWE